MIRLTKLRLETPIAALEPRHLFSGIAYASPVLYTESGDPGHIQIADVTGDSKPDLITVDTASGSTLIHILAGNGNGTFHTPTTFDLGFQPAVENTGNFVALDLNGDGKTDLLVQDSYHTEQLLFGNGNGTFQAPVAINSETGIPLAGDVNGDGSPELVYQVGGGSLAVLINNGDGSFAAPVTIAIGSSEGLVSLADLNADGRADLLLVDVSSGAAGVRLNTSNASFGSEQTYATGVMAFNATAVDLNGDQKRDLIVSSPGSLAILINNGAGAFNAPTTLAPTSQHALTIFSGDVDGDGKTDLIGIGEGTYASSTIAIFLGNGDGTFQSEQDVSDPSHTITSLVTADLNGDGKTDLAAVSTGAQTVDVFNTTFASISNGILTINGTSGADSITVTDNAGSVVATLNGTASPTFTGVIGIVITGGAGNDSISVAGVPINATVGGAGGIDSITGGAGNDSLRGGALADTLGAAGGNDTCVGGGDNDSLRGGAGNDSILGGPGNDTLKGGVGNDTLYGGIGSDSVNGNADNDSLTAGSGSSQLDGGPGVNSIIGSTTSGFGANTINLSSGANSLLAGSADLIIGQGADDTVTVQ